MEALKIVIADDHPVVLAGTCAVLQQSRQSMQIAGMAGSGAELLALLARCSCDVLVTDFSMPRPGSARNDGMALMRTLRRQHPQLPIVVMTVLQNRAILLAMRGLGILGLVEKSSTLDELVAAVQAAAAGHRYVSRELRNRLDEQAASTATALSSHEIEVVRLFAGGMSVTAISRLLHRSVKTISRQKSDAMRKLGLQNHSELYAYARDNGLLA